MTKKSLIKSIIVIGGVTLLILTYQSRANASADNGYEGGSKVKREMYYDIIDIQPMEVQSNTLHIEETSYMVGEVEVAGIFACNVDIKAKKEKKVNRWDIKLTDDEIELLAKIVWTECRGESDRGQRGVIEVIFNRMIYDGIFGKTLEDVLSQKNQFQSWGLRNNAEPTDKEYDNIKKVLNGDTDILDFNTVYFSTSPRNNDVAEHIGGHYFCRFEK